ncbi:M28 family peptidase [Rhabdonatronobacter sediminivivens]|nr:M28 family peptidase [Rhabdonatronobacter sediminivivens]
MTHMSDTPDTRLWAEFAAICDCGGRQSGTASERAAVALLDRLGRAATGVAPQVLETAYDGWRAIEASVTDAAGQVLPATALLRSAPTPDDGLALELIDLGRGTAADFAAQAGAIAGRAVMVRHELMFCADTVHRRLKYGWALAHGAAAFIIVGPDEGSSVAGSSGRGGEAGIPAIGIAPETARQLLAGQAGPVPIRLTLLTEEAPALAPNLIFDMPGGTAESPGDRKEWVVLSAHLDGHALGESAIDNASGCAVALAVARALAPGMAERRRGLRLAFFNVEEWALTGSADYVARLSPQDRAAIALNVNLDSVAGGSRLTALTSGFAGIEPMLQGCADRVGLPLGLHRPLQRNSDHANFAEAGIPAFRLVAGFGEPEARTRHLLTRFDTRQIVAPQALEEARALAQAICETALDAPPEDAANWRA